MVPKFAIFLASLLILSTSASLSDSLSSRFLSYAYVTKNGNVTLQKDVNGFYANVDFAYHYSDASDSETYDSAAQAVSIGLYTSQTILTQNCQGFYDYCNIYSCSNPYNSVSLNLPYFIVTGYTTSAIVYLDYSNWELTSTATIATECGGNSYTIGNARYGLVGLGLNSSTSSNFIGGATTFSIWLSPDLSRGYLAFSEDSAITSSASLVGTLYTDSEWNISPSLISVQVSQNSDSFYAGVIFDINADAIGFPSSVYGTIISYLSNTPSLYCTSGTTYKPYCDYNGELGNLPTVQLTINGIQIAIPPSVYIESYNTLGYSDDSDIGGGFVLNFKSLDDSLSYQSYVTPAYENYLILDQNFMSYYYTQFNFGYGVNSISIYQQYSSNSSSVPAWPFIVGGIILLIIIVVGMVYCVRDRKRRAMDRAARVQTEEVITTTEAFQAPEANVPYQPYNYPSYNYGQANYNYPPQYALQYPSQPFGNNNSNNPSNYPYVASGQGQF